MAWDEKGRLFVAENPDYPTGPKDGHKPAGAIVELRDHDGDGTADERIVFASELGFPNGLMPWRGGWLVTDSPNLLWLADTNQDGKADRREIWFSGFATNSTTQLRACYPMLGPDGWIYVSRGWSGGVLRSEKWPGLPPVDLKDGDFRFRPDGSAAEAIGGNAQFGMALDDAGRRFLTSNRNPLMHAVVHRRSWLQHPFLPMTDIVQDVSPVGAGAKVFPLTADTTTAGLMPELMSAPHAGSFTSACGLLQFYGPALPLQFQGSWFICEPAQNTIQRQIVEPSGATFKSRRATEGRDFLASKDPWFRPVFTAAGPDGALYIADMYRGSIEHPDYLPEAARKQFDFYSGREMGRIWRIGGQIDRKTQFAPESSVQSLADKLSAPSLWVRQTAHRLLVEREDSHTTAILTRKLSSGRTADLDWRESARLVEDPEMGPHLGRARMILLVGDLWNATESTGFLEQVKFATFDPSPAVRSAAWQTAQSRPEIARYLFSAAEPELLNWWADDPSASASFKYALACAQQTHRPTVLASLGRVVHQHGDDRWVRAAVLSGTRDRELQFFQLIRGSVTNRSTGSALMNELGLMIGSNPRLDPAEMLIGSLRHLPNASAMSALSGVAEGFRRKGGGSLQQQVSLLVKARQGLSDLAGRLDDLVKMASSHVRRSDPIQQRLAAVRFLSYLDLDQSRDALVEALRPTQPQELQVAAARALAQHDDVAVATLLTESDRLNAFSPAVREVVVTALTSRSEFVPSLLHAIETGAIPRWALDPQKRSRLLAHKDKKIQARAEKLFGGASDDNRRKVFDEVKGVLTQPNDARAGRAIFERSCAACHQRDGVGAKVGPDLSSIKNQPADAILLHIIDPNAEVHPGYQSYAVETRDGRNITGLLAAESELSITLRTAGGVDEVVQRAELRSFTGSAVSLMPTELETTMTRQELADLIAYLKSREP